jgi:hypothetical protein
MKDKLIPISILISVLIIAVSFVYKSGLETDSELILSPEGFVLPVKWGDLSRKLVEAGVIDVEKFEAIYSSRGGLSEETRGLFTSAGDLTISPENAGEVLNLLWAFGLANKNAVLEKGPMTDPRYSGPGRFASTGGWTLARGDAMKHYSRHPFVVLTEEQQELVERVAKNIYRPCCNNSTYFPDCNHGMAMLGFLELMAAQGANEEEMYRAALRVNSLWFPDTYAAIGEYLSLEGGFLESADPKEILGADFSGASGYRKILSKITPPETKNGASCGV